MTDQPDFPVPATSPLAADDPTKVGDFWLDSRLTATAAGVVYLAHEEGGPPVMVLLLSRGAADDAAARDRLAGQIDRLHIDTVLARGGQDQNRGRLGSKFRPEDDDPVTVDSGPGAPWAALAFDGSPAAVHEARRLLAEVDLAWKAQQGYQTGPDYRLHWSDRRAPGLAKVWPLPWPGRRDRGGATSIAASFAIMLALAASGILIAILLFSQSPPTPPMPPEPTAGQGTGTGSPPPSGSSDSGSPPPNSASASGSPSGSPSSATASASSSGSASASASPSPGRSSASGSPSRSPGQTPSAGGGGPSPQQPI